MIKHNDQSYLQIRGASALKVLGGPNLHGHCKERVGGSRRYSKPADIICKHACVPGQGADVHGCADYVAQGVPPSLQANEDVRGLSKQGQKSQCASENTADFGDLPKKILALQWPLSERGKLTTEKDRNI